MKKGDLVICKSDFNRCWYDWIVRTNKPKVGTIYTVRETGRDRNGSKYVLLVEVLNKKHHFTCGWPCFIRMKSETIFCKKAFKKIHFNTSEIDELKQVPTFNY